MIKTNPYSRFALLTLAKIRDSKDIILQAEKTDSTFTETKEGCYLCEVVDSLNYPRNTMESLVAENIKLNNDCRKLREKIEKLEKASR